MKKIYSAVLLIAISSGMNAQLTLTKAANEPVLGDIHTTKQYDSTAVIPKSTGTAQSWNFTNLAPQTFTEATTYTTVGAIPSGSLYPSANLASTRGGNEVEFHKTTGADWEWFGSVKTATPMEITTMTNSAIMASWPISYSSTNNDVFVGAMTIGTMVSTWSGSISTSGSGSGTVTLPGGATFTNCLQVVRTISLAITSGTNVSIYKEKTYSYYSAGKKFPIIDVSYRTVPQGSVSVNEYNIFADLSLVPVGINEISSVSNALNVYPNPANELVYVSTEKDVNLIEIIDINGRVVKEAKYTNVINVKGIAPSIYTIKVKSNNSVLNKRLVICE